MNGLWPTSAHLTHKTIFHEPQYSFLCADEAKDLLTKIAMETSLRYAIHLITSSSLIATRRKAALVEVRDIPILILPKIP